MSEPKWTPGPWQVCNTYHAVHGERVKNIALCGNAHIPQGNGRILVPEDEVKANAHLIAAAPDLYEALQDILDNEMPDYKAAEEFGGYVLDDALRERAIRALRKARGEDA